MGPQKPRFDVQGAKQAIEKGRRSKWWQRKGTMSRGFTYVDHLGKKIVGLEDIERIKSIVIPPAWKHVRISPSPSGSLQAVGMDTTGRVQYLYRQQFTERRQKKKFAKIEKFGEYLPKLRRITNEHLQLDGYPREKVLAVVMRLINYLYIRLGSEKSVRHYKTYGITTLRNKHLRFGRKGKLIFDFVGKSHVKQRKILVDPELARIMKELQDLGPARKLFNYLDEDGRLRAVKPAEVNDYLKTATAPEFSSKDFRTWAGSLLAARELAEMGAAEDEKQLKKNLVRAVERVAEQLGNTPSVCRGSYIHPAVIKAYESGKTLGDFAPRKMRRINSIQADMEPGEKALLNLFQDRSNGKQSNSE